MRLTILLPSTLFFHPHQAGKPYSESIPGIFVIGCDYLYTLVGFSGTFRFKKIECILFAFKNYTV